MERHSQILCRFYAQMAPRRPYRCRLWCLEPKACFLSELAMRVATAEALVKEQQTDAKKKAFADGQQTEEGAKRCARDHHQ